MEVTKELKRICKVDKIYHCASGTEANMAAVKLARSYQSHIGYQSKQKLILFDICFHGWGESVINKMSSGINTKDVIILKRNGFESIKYIQDNADSIACILFETKMGLDIDASRKVSYNEEVQFISTLRRVTHDNNIILIWDEVISGFRYSLGGAKEFFGMNENSADFPDITTYGKIPGGGLPCGFIGFKNKLHHYFNKNDNKLLFNWGTYSQHPFLMKSMKYTIERLHNSNNDGKYNKLNACTQSLVDSINNDNNITKFGFSAQCCCSFFLIYNQSHPNCIKVLTYYLNMNGILVHTYSSSTLQLSFSHSNNICKELHIRIKQAVEEIIDDGWLSLQ